MPTAGSHVEAELDGPEQEWTLNLFAKGHLRLTKCQKERGGLMGHPGPSIRPSAGSWATLGRSARRRTTFPLTCSTSPLNFKRINRAADTEKMRQLRRVCILIFSLMTIPATHFSSPNRYQSAARLCYVPRILMRRSFAYDSQIADNQ